jgi:hypothetical protein
MDITHILPNAEKQRCSLDSISCTNKLDACTDTLMGCIRTNLACLPARGLKIIRLQSDMLLQAESSTRLMPSHRHQVELFSFSREL